MKTSNIFAPRRALGLILIGCSLTGGPALAQVPGIIQYQGRLTTNDVNFTGTGQFKFALVEQVIVGQSVWSNDDTSVNGSEPDTSVSVVVNDGLFSVALGDTALSNMKPVPASAFAYADVRLRIWFSDGQGAFEQLVPDQRIASVPYALVAGDVADAAITAAKIVDGTITGAKLEPNTITSGEVADNLTFQELNVGGPDWNGLLQLHAQGSGELRGKLLGDGNGSELDLMFANSTLGAVLSAKPPGGRLQLWDIFQLPTIEAGSWNTGGGELRLFQITSNPGIELIGDRGTYPGPSQGGVLRVFDAGGNTGTVELQGAETASTGGRILLRQSNDAETVSLDAENGQSGGGRLDLRRGDQTTTFSVRANDGGTGGMLLMYEADGTETVRIDAEDGANGGGRIDLQSNTGASVVNLHANGTDVSVTGGGNITVGSLTGFNLAIDNNEIMARQNAGPAPLYLNYGSGTTLTSRLSINTQSPATGYELSVNGQIICEELVVQDSADWPDYVFADDYRLAPLEEVEASIKANRHLPGIPPAAVVGEAGISLGAMQKNMMEKIEELTLYIIEQNKRLNAQAAELQALRSQFPTSGLR